MTGTRMKCAVCGTPIMKKAGKKGGRPRTYCNRIVEPIYIRTSDGAIKMNGRKRIQAYENGRPSFLVREARKGETPTCHEIAKFEQRFQGYAWKLTHLVEQDDEAGRPSENGRRRLQEFKTGLFAMLSEVVAKSGPLVRSRFRGDRIGWKLNGNVKPGHLPGDDNA